MAVSLSFLLFLFFREGKSEVRRKEEEEGGRRAPIERSICPSFSPLSSLALSPRSLSLSRRQRQSRDSHLVASERRESDRVPSARGKEKKFFFFLVGEGEKSVKCFVTKPLC
jgi:hypothetical protein